MRFTVPCDGNYQENITILREYTIYGRILTICNVTYTETVGHAVSGGSETAIFIDGQLLPSADILDALDGLLQIDPAREVE